MIKKLICKIKGHVWIKGYYGPYPWNTCRRCYQMGEPLIGKPKKRFK